MKITKLSAVASACVLIGVLAGCGPTDVGQTTGTGPTVDQRIAAIQNSKAPQEVKDRTIADLKAHAQAYEKSRGGGAASQGMPPKTP